jgi:hypothetical protein
MNSNDVFYVHCYLEGQVTPRFFMLDACLCSAQCTQLNTVTRLVFGVFPFICSITNIFYFFGQAPAIFSTAVILQLRLL